jgi:hypothetical protein
MVRRLWEHSTQSPLPYSALACNDAFIFSVSYSLEGPTLRIKAKDVPHHREQPGCNPARNRPLQLGRPPQGPTA